MKYPASRAIPPTGTLPPHSVIGGLESGGRALASVFHGWWRDTGSGMEKCLSCLGKCSLACQSAAASPARPRRSARTSPIAGCRRGGGRRWPSWCQLSALAHVQFSRRYRSGAPPASHSAEAEAPAGTSEAGGFRGNQGRPRWPATLNVCRRPGRRRIGQMKARSLLQRSSSALSRARGAMPLAGVLAVSAPAVSRWSMGSSRSRAGRCVSRATA
jgi:hypothetical protein